MGEMGGLIIAEAVFDSYGIDCVLKVYPNNYIEVLGMKSKEPEYLLLGGFSSAFDYFFLDNNISICIKGSEDEEGSVLPSILTGMLPGQVIQLYKRLKS